MLNDQSKNWDTGTHENFFRFYEQQSLTPETLARFQSVRQTLLRVYGTLPTGRKLDILDVGCGAGTQALFWARDGHRYWGIDINEPLVQLARQRAEAQEIDARFDVGSATELPCGNETIDICLLPELLEHVADWRGCLDEAIRVLRPGGVIYINTSSKLCPKQQEFRLPIYSWYPSFLKRYYVRRALTDRPELANYAKYPAVNWFSVYGLRNYLKARGIQCLDRFDLIDDSKQSTLGRFTLVLIRRVPMLRFFGHALTPYTLIVGKRQR